MVEAGRQLASKAKANRGKGKPWGRRLEGRSRLGAEAKVVESWVIQQQQRNPQVGAEAPRGRAAHRLEAGRP